MSFSKQVLVRLPAGCQCSKIGCQPSSSPMKSSRAEDDCRSLTSEMPMRLSESPDVSKFTGFWAVVSCSIQVEDRTRSQSRLTKVSSQTSFIQYCQRLRFTFSRSLLVQATQERFELHVLFISRECSCWAHSLGYCNSGFFRVSYLHFANRQIVWSIHLRYPSLLDSNLYFNTRFDVRLF